MSNKLKSKEITELREIASQAISTETGATDVTDSVRESLESIRREAAEYGLTDADVIRALLKPIFKKTKGCDCYTCRARRGEIGEDGESELRGVHMNAS